MTIGRCTGNPAQYERNRRFRHLVYVLGRSANGATLPSVGLWLNASKSESRPECRDDTLCTAAVGRRRYARPISCPRVKAAGRDAAVQPQIWAPRAPADSWPAAGRNEIHPTQCSGVKSFVDDLALGRGVVLSRAATTLRSIETKPLD